MRNSCILTITCPDRPGLVAAISSLIFHHGGNILEARQFEDSDTGRFFMRLEFAYSAEESPDSAMREGLGALAASHGMTWKLRLAAEKQRALILVSKFDHCLGDLLYRTRLGELPMDIVGIVSNHPGDALQTSLIDPFPFHYLPVTRDTKAEQEAEIRALIERTGTDLVILARYMQVLSHDFSRYLEGRCINIHHSFLPGFKGAKPYHQAYARGVKMIGATAHYVTADLDEGPIIAQDVEPVSHADKAEDLVRKGRDIERRVLARAVLHHLEGRVFVNGIKTVVL